MSDKKKKKSATGGVTLGMLAVVALLFFLGNDGGGIGGGSGSGIISDGPSVQYYQEEAQPAATEAPKAVLEVTVSGSDYLFQNQRLDLTVLVTQLSDYGKDADIRISSDETATINAMNALTDALAANGFTNYSKR